MTYADQITYQRVSLASTTIGDDSRFTLSADLIWNSRMPIFFYNPVKITKLNWNSTIIRWHRRIITVQVLR
jgi:hypothetical protein